MDLLRIVLMSLLPAFSGLTVLAQGLDNPVKWDFEVTAVEGEPEVYRFTATGTIDSGFHIWALDAGGDGSLIPTAFTWNEATQVDWQGDWEESPAPVTHQLEFIEGAVHWHEQQARFSRKFKIHNRSGLAGEVLFQTCNEASCFPPESVNFMVKLP